VFPLVSHNFDHDNSIRRGDVEDADTSRGAYTKTRQRRQPPATTVKLAMTEPGNSNSDQRGLNHDHSDDDIASDPVTAVLPLAPSIASVTWLR
jgi:hypothetical protein